MSNLVKPPLSNTGGDCANTVVHFGIDYLRGTVPVRSHLEVKTFLGYLFNTRFDLVTDRDGRPLGTSFYKLRYTSEQSIDILCYNRSIADGSTDNHALINISGSALAALDQSEVYLLFANLSDFGFKPTRLDLKADDFSKTITPQLAMCAAEEGNKFGFRRYSYQQDDRGAGTFYAGSRGSAGGGKFVRIYDKHIESDGEIDAVRIELEASSEKAVDIFTVLLSVEVGEWFEVIRGFIVAAIGFIDRSTGKQKCRCKYLDWWQWFVLGKYKCVFSPVRKVTSIDKTLMWLKNQVAAPLAMVLCAKVGTMPDLMHSEAQVSFLDLLYQLLIEGSDSLKKRHKSKIVEYWMNPGECSTLFA